MQKKIIKFLKLNKKLFNNHSQSNKTIALVNRERLLNTIEGSIVSCALANLKNLNIVVITDSVYEDLNKIFKSFGLNNFYIVSSFKNYFLFFLYSIISIIKVLQTFVFISFVGFNEFIKNFKFNGILVGDLIYDSYIRHDLSFINPKIDLKFLKICFFCYFKVLRLGKFFKSNKIKYLIVHTDCFAKNDALSIRLSWKEKVKVLKLLSNKKKIFFVESHKYETLDGFKPIHKRLTKKNLNKIIPYSMKKLEQIIFKRFTGKINSTYTNQIDLKNANKIKIQSDRNSLINKLFKNPKKFEKVILFAPHAFSDAPHHFGSFLFRDYWDQFVQTIAYFQKKKFKKTLFLIRPHPSSYMYNEENLIKDYITNLNENIKLCDANLISTTNLIKICDTVITGRGTIGLEFACFGKRPIIAGSATYSKFGITTSPKTVEEYFRCFSMSKVYEPLTKQQILIARKILYYIENVYPKYFDHKLDNMIMNYKDKSIIGTSNDNDQILSNRLLKFLKLKSFKDDLLYKFFYENGKHL